MRPMMQFDYIVVLCGVLCSEDLPCSSLIAPLFGSMILFMMPWQQETSNEIQVMQDNCLGSCLLYNKWKTRGELYARSGVLPLKKQREISTPGLVYQGLNQLSTPFINDLSTMVCNEGRVTRSEIKGNVVIPWFRLETPKGNITVRGPPYYNVIWKSYQSTGHYCWNSVQYTMGKHHRLWHISSAGLR